MRIEFRSHSRSVIKAIQNYPNQNVWFQPSLKGDTCTMEHISNQSKAARVTMVVETLEDATRWLGLSK